MRASMTPEKASKLRAMLVQADVRWAEREKRKLELLDMLDEMFDDILDEIELTPDECPVRIDHINHVIYPVGMDAYRPTKRARVTVLVVMVLEDARLRAPDRSGRDPIPVWLITRRVQRLFTELYGSRAVGCGKRTIERVLRELRASSHPLGMWIVRVRGKLGGYYLDTSR